MRRNVLCKGVGIALILCLALALGSCAHSPPYDLGKGQVCMDDALTLGMPLEEAPGDWMLVRGQYQKWFAYQEIGFEGILQADQDHTLRRVGCIGLGDVTEEKLQGLLEAMETAYGEAMDAYFENDGLSSYVYTSGDYRYWVTVYRKTADGIKVSVDFGVVPPE